MLGWNLGKRLWSKSLLKKRTRFPVEGVLLPGREQGWRAATAGTQIIRLLFDRPQTIRTIRLLFKEYEVARAQEFVLRWLPHGTRSWKDVVRQQRNFSPSQAVEECEEYHVDLAWAAALELSIEPDIRQWGIRALLERLQLSYGRKRNLGSWRLGSGREFAANARSVLLLGSAAGDHMGLRATFEAFGQVLTVRLVRDRDTGVPRGFAFIEMGNDAEAQAAIGALNGSTIVGQVVRVNEARPKPKDSKGTGLKCVVIANTDTSR
jgi:hypothetical protein